MWRFGATFADREWSVGWKARSGNECAFPRIQLVFLRATILSLAWVSLEQNASAISFRWNCAYLPPLTTQFSFKSLPSSYGPAIWAISFPDSSVILGASGGTETGRKHKKLTRLLLFGPKLMVTCTEEPSINIFW